MFRNMAYRNFKFKTTESHEDVKLNHQKNVLMVMQVCMTNENIETENSKVFML